MGSFSNILLELWNCIAFKVNGSSPNEYLLFYSNATSARTRGVSGKYLSQGGKSSVANSSGIASSAPASISAGKLIFDPQSAKSSSGKKFKKGKIMSPGKSNFVPVKSNANQTVPQNCVSTTSDVAIPEKSLVTEKWVTKKFKLDDIFL